MLTGSSPVMRRVRSFIASSSIKRKSESAID